MEKEKKPLVHHVFFWLKNPDSKEDLAKLLAGLQTLRKDSKQSGKSILVYLPVRRRAMWSTTSYHASELMFFDDLAGQKTYQDHPIHQKFIADCSHLWEKVVVYDSMDV